jgi:hypothetical protein
MQEEGLLGKDLVGNLRRLHSNYRNTGCGLEGNHTKLKSYRGGLLDTDKVGNNLVMLDWENQDPYSEQNLEAVRSILADPNRQLEELLDCEYAVLLLQNYPNELRN